jgi:hypothetical protein
LISGALERQFPFNWSKQKSTLHNVGHGSDFVVVVGVVEVFAFDLHATERMRTGIRTESRMNMENVTGKRRF